MSWIDLALLVDEDSLFKAIETMGGNDRTKAISNIAKKLSLTQKDIEAATLRILVERVRPFALPHELWSRPITSSDNPARLILDHFKRNKIQPSAELLEMATTLYLRFAEERGKVGVTEAHLKSCGYRCQHCGLAFCDEDLARKAFVSPHGLRGKPKQDPLKPHWNGKDSDREPTLDHDWPISLYGGNNAANMRVLCKACNLGKENYTAKEQMWPFVGLLRREQLAQKVPLPYQVFYAQIRRAGMCSETGRTSAQTELTVRLVDPLGPYVLDNLITVESEGL